MITLQEFLHTPALIMKVLEAGNKDLEDWFNATFPTGEATEDEIITALKPQVAAPKMASYSWDGKNEVLTVYNKMGVVDFCEDKHISLSDFNKKVIIAGTASDFSGLLASCESFNQSLDIPSTVKKASHMLHSCRSLNSPVTLCEGLEDASQMFCYCDHFNQPIELPSTLTNTQEMFCHAHQFNQPIKLGDNIQQADNMFCSCTKLSQDIELPAQLQGNKTLFSYCPLMTSYGRGLFKEGATSYFSR